MNFWDFFYKNNLIKGLAFVESGYVEILKVDSGSGEVKQKIFSAKVTSKIRKSHEVVTRVPITLFVKYSDF